MTEYTTAASTTVSTNISPTRKRLIDSLSRSRGEIEPKRNHARKTPQVSNYGRIRNCHGIISYGSECVAGYMRTCVNRLLCSVHFLVVLHFIGEPPAANLEIDHIDRNRSNNQVENLRYVTKLENMRNRDPDRIRPSEPIEAKRKTEGDDFWVPFASVESAANFFGFPIGNIRHVCSGYNLRRADTIFDMQNHVMKCYQEKNFVNLLKVMSKLAILVDYEDI
jgi:hypothetical protein